MFIFKLFLLGKFYVSALLRFEYFIKRYDAINRPENFRNNDNFLLPSEKLMEI